MNIVVCGSMSNYAKMVDLKNQLETMGHKVTLPGPIGNTNLEEINKNNYIETFEWKIRFDLIREHYNRIIENDAVLIANYSKNGIENYVGGNAFLEMGFAHILNKPLYLLNPIPNIGFYYHEMKAMKPIVLNGNLHKIL